MKVFALQIQMGNAAFGETPHEAAGEVAAILRTLADKYERQGAVDETNLRDSNGNTVGLATVVT